MCFDLVRSGDREKRTLRGGIQEGGVVKMEVDLMLTHPRVCHRLGLMMVMYWEVEKYDSELHVQQQSCWIER